MITLNSPIIGKGVTNGAIIVPGGAKRTREIFAYRKELTRLCRLVGFNEDILLAQAMHETDDFRSHWWEAELNPAGIGIFDDGSTQRMAYKTGTDAARAHVVHMAAYVYGGLLGPWESLKDYRYLDPRYQAVFDAGLNKSVKVLGDLGGGRWATDPKYAEKIAAKANAIFGVNDSGVSDTTGGASKGNVMTKYQIVGLPGPGIELPVPLAHRILPKSQTKQRPGIKRKLPGFWVQHETDNHARGADAMMHARYLENGAEGRQASWHFTVDDGQIVQHIPIDEVTWQAADGAGPGNMSGISCELCVNLGIDTAKARHNAEALCAGIMDALNMGIDRCKAHIDFNAGTADRHHCPDTMLNDGYWPTTFHANVVKLWGAPAPKPKPVPFPIDWKRGDVGFGTLGGHPREAFVHEVTAKRETPLRQGADSKSPETHPRIKAGEKAVTVGVVTVPTSGGGKASWFLVDVGDGTFPRASASAFTPTLPRP